MKKIYLIAAVIALVAGFATYFFAMELKTSKIVTGVDEATVLIAVQDIDENTILTKEMFQEIKLPQTAVSYGTISDVKDIIGYMSTDKILRGEQLMARKVTLVGDEKAEERLSYELGNGMYAYTLNVGIENGIGYFLKENDKVNIYNAAAPASEPVLENIPVIRISNYPANIQQDAGVEITSFAEVTFVLTKEQIPKLMALNGAIRMVLVPYAEGHSLVDDLANASVPEDRNDEPQTNYGMGEITTAPPETAKQ